MTAPWSRRGFLTASTDTAVALGLGSQAFAAADEFATLRASLALTWRRPVAVVVSAPATVASATTGSALTLAFGDLTATAGATQRITVRLG
ncbi:twin-arginine translocation signal domain-containing protein [Streptomyces sp. NPDC001410]|uniref:twin-arginine translocation signal domain-containing protein n=1 Tax=Streptomyces sp. NPDC001410 TaxID=3364574 RepID=UPI0036AE4F6D